MHNFQINCLAFLIALLSHTFSSSLIASTKSAGDLASTGKSSYASVNNGTILNFFVAEPIDFRTDLVVYSVLPSSSPCSPPNINAPLAPIRSAETSRNSAASPPSNESPRSFKFPRVIEALHYATHWIKSGERIGTPPTSPRPAAQVVDFFGKFSIEEIISRVEPGITEAGFEFFKRMQGPLSSDRNVPSSWTTGLEGIDFTLAQAGVYGVVWADGSVYIGQSLSKITSTTSALSDISHLMSAEGLAYVKLHGARGIQARTAMQHANPLYRSNNPSRLYRKRPDNPILVFPIYISTINLDAIGHIKDDEYALVSIVEYLGIYGVGSIQSSTFWMSWKAWSKSIRETANPIIKLEEKFRLTKLKLNVQLGLESTRPADPSLFLLSKAMLRLTRYGAPNTQQSYTSLQIQSHGRLYDGVLPLPARFCIKYGALVLNKLAYITVSFQPQDLRNRLLAQFADSEIDFDFRALANVPLDSPDAAIIVVMVCIEDEGTRRWIGTTIHNDDWEKNSALGVSRARMFERINPWIFNYFGPINDILVSEAHSTSPTVMKEYQELQATAAREPTLQVDWQDQGEGGVEVEEE